MAFDRHLVITCAYNRPKSQRNQMTFWSQKHPQIKELSSFCATHFRYPPPPLKLTNRTCKWMVGRLYTFLLGCHVFRCYLSFREGYSYKWPYTWATGVITLLIRVLAPVLISRGPPCTPEISVIAMIQGGEECDPKATMEIGKCPRRCGGQKFCEWTVWGTCLGLQIHKSDMFIHILVYRICTYFAVYT